MKKSALILATITLLAGFQPAIANEQKRKPPTFAEMDQNSDGELTKDEVKGPLLNDFDKFDSDGSGTLTESELPEPPSPKGH